MPWSITFMIASSVMVMIREPPGLPITMNGLPSFDTIVGLIDDSGDLPRRDRVGLALHQAVEVRHARLHGEVVHLVVEQDAGALGHLAGPERAVERVGDGDGVAVLVDDRIVRRLGGLGEARRSSASRRDAGAVRVDPAADLLGIGLAGQLRRPDCRRSPDRRARCCGRHRRGASPRPSAASSRPSRSRDRRSDSPRGC